MEGPLHVFAAFAPVMKGFLEAALPGRPMVAMSNEAEFAAGLPDAEFLLTLDTPPGHWALGQKLRLIQGFGAGIDDVLPAPGLRAGVQIANNKGAAAPTMAEFGLSLVLALLKGLPGAVAAQRRHEFKRFTPETMAGKTLLIIGLGAIGSALAERAAALGMRVTGVQRTPKAHAAVDRVYPETETAAALAEADVVVLLLPLTPETRGSFGAERIAEMKPGARLVNLARGGIVDEAALLEALASGHVANAAFDVFEPEPIPEDSPLWDAENLLITPHVAGGYPEYLTDLSALFAENVRRVEAGETVRNAIDPARGY